VSPVEVVYGVHEQVLRAFAGRAAVTCEAAPLQVVGHIRGLAFYFRARSGSWRLGVAPEVSTAVAITMFGPQRWGDPEPDDQVDAGTFGTWLLDLVTEVIDETPWIIKVTG
jgi:hypothetical protein